MMLTALHNIPPTTTTTTSQKDSFIPPIYDPFDNANAWGTTNNNQNNNDDRYIQLIRNILFPNLVQIFDELDFGNTHRLLEAIEQQKKVVEVELTRLKEQATGATQQNEWHAPPDPSAAYKFIQRQHPRVVVPKHEEMNDEHRLMKKTRANWTLPSMTQQNPTQSSINMPNLTPEELNLLKEVAVSPSFAELQQHKKIRMVTHFQQQRLSEKPPIPSRNNKKTLNGVKSSLIVRSEYRHGDGTPDRNTFKTAGENIVKKHRDIRTPDHGGMRSIMSTHKGTESTTNFTADNRTRMSNNVAFSASNQQSIRVRHRSLSKNASQNIDQLAQIKSYVQNKREAFKRIIAEKSLSVLDGRFSPKKKSHTPHLRVLEQQSENIRVHRNLNPPQTTNLLQNNMKRAIQQNKAILSSKMQEYDRKYTIGGPEGIFSSATTDYEGTEDHLPRKMSESDLNDPLRPITMSPNRPSDIHPMSDLRSAKKPRILSGTVKNTLHKSPVQTKKAIVSSTRDLMKIVTNGGIPQSSRNLAHI